MQIYAQRCTKYSRLILMLALFTHPSGMCTWGIKISVGMHYFVTIHLQKVNKQLLKELKWF